MVSALAGRNAVGVGSLVSQEAARVWSDPANRARIVQMHADGRSLVEMTDALGLGAALDADGLRAVVDALTPDEVQLVRDAFVAEAGRTRGAGASFPVDCTLDDFSGVRLEPGATTRGAVAPVVRVVQG
jgi:hypothetical protein